MIIFSRNRVSQYILNQSDFLGEKPGFFFTNPLVIAIMERQERDRALSLPTPTYPQIIL
ncbi:MAG: hypothetical protein ACRCT1_02570 [Microcoleaceae cyanobacterium]